MNSNLIVNSLRRFSYDFRHDNYIVSSKNLYHLEISTEVFADEINEMILAFFFFPLPKISSGAEE